jgi:acyl carrier protein phosphodiesterase
VRRRYAGILLDIFYDHVLIANWSSYSDEPVERLISRFYRALQERQALLPERVQRMLPHMVRHDWLGSYREFSGIEIAIERVSQRLSRNGNMLRDGIEDLRQHYGSLSAGFQVFFPDLIRFADGLRATMLAAQAV